MHDSWKPGPRAVHARQTLWLPAAFLVHVFFCHWPSGRKTRTVLPTSTHILTVLLQRAWLPFFPWVGLDTSARLSEHYANQAKIENSPLPCSQVQDAKPELWLALDADSSPWWLSGCPLWGPVSLDYILQHIPQRPGDVAPWVGCMPSINKALGSIPSTT